jgi:hypothetical protein
MTETIIKKYHCDYCGEEINQSSPEAIHIFINRGAECAIVPMKQIMDANRKISFIVESGDYCSVEHFCEIIKRGIKR